MHDGLRDSVEFFLGLLKKLNSDLDSRAHTCSMNVENRLNFEFTLTECYTLDFRICFTISDENFQGTVVKFGFCSERKAVCSPDIGLSIFLVELTDTIDDRPPPDLDIQNLQLFQGSAE